MSRFLTLISGTALALTLGASAVQAGDPDLTVRLHAYDRMRARAADAMADFVDHRQVSNGAPLRLLGTSGTVTTLGSVHLGLTRYSRDLVDGLMLTDEECRAISRRLAEMTMEDRAHVACIVAQSITESVE